MEYKPEEKLPLLQHHEREYQENTNSPNTQLSSYQANTSVDMSQPPLENENSRCRNLLVTVALLLNGLNIGLNVGLLGPSLPDLAVVTDSTIGQMSIVFIFTAVGYMCGSFACGFLLGRFDGYLLVGLTLILQAIATAIAPWSSNLAVVTIFISLSYFFSTLIVAGTAYLCFRLERSRARVMTQAVFLLFNLGKAVVPIVLEPFLAPESPAPSTIVTNSSSILENQTNVMKSGEIPHIFALNNDSGSISNSTNRLNENNTSSSVGIGYVIVGGISILISLLYMLVSGLTGCHLWASHEERLRKDPAEEMAEAKETVTRARKTLVLLTFFLMIFLQCGMESVDAGLMMTFMTEYLHKTKDAGILANSLYQGFKVVACIAVVLTVKFIHPSCLLLIDFSFMLGATVLMSASIWLDLGNGLLWATFVLLAIGMSNSYATLASWLETRYTITGLVASLLTIGFGLGAMLLPPLTTKLMDIHGPIMFPLVLLSCTMLCFIMYFITKVLMKEACCPKPDIGGEPSNSRIPYDKLTSSTEGQLLLATTGSSTTQTGIVQRLGKQSSVSEAELETHLSVKEPIEHQTQLKEPTQKHPLQDPIKTNDKNGTAEMKPLITHASTDKHSGYE